jgi:hypothetical protein
MFELGSAERFEEAAEVRNRAAAISRIETRRRRIEMLERIDRLVLEDRRGARIELGPGGMPRVAGRDPEPATLTDALCVASWLHRNAGSLRVVEAESGLASPLPALPDYAPRSG